MDIKIVAYSALPCEAGLFEINGVSACKDDFGRNYDIGSFDYEYGELDDENWACADNRFMSKEEVNQEVLVKYGITEDEYREIQAKLESEFCVGNCSWCV